VYPFPGENEEDTEFGRQRGPPKGGRRIRESKGIREPVRLQLLQRNGLGKLLAVRLLENFSEKKDGKGQDDALSSFCLGATEFGREKEVGEMRAFLGGKIEIAASREKVISHEGVGQSGLAEAS